jgi:hypothetical protein
MAPPTGVGAAIFRCSGFGECRFDQAAASDQVVERGLQFTPAFTVGGKRRRGRRGCRSRHQARLAAHAFSTALPVIELRPGTEERRLVRGCRRLHVGCAVIVVLVDLGRRLVRAFAPDILNERQALFAQDALHAADGIALAIEQVAYAAQQVDVVGTVVAPAAAALERADLGEAALPEAQYVLRDADLLSNFADGAERVRRFFQESLLHVDH